MRLCGISSRFQLLSPSTRQVTHALLTRPPLTYISLGFNVSPFDLHVLGTPPAFILSQDQTLMLKWCLCPASFIWHCLLLIRVASRSFDRSACSWISLKILEFSGLHYCLFVKDQWFFVAVVLSGNSDILSWPLSFVNNFFDFFKSFFQPKNFVSAVGFHTTILFPALSTTFYIYFSKHLQWHKRRKKRNLNLLRFFSYFLLVVNGERGIWTLAPIARPTPLAGAPLQPLEYFSTVWIVSSTNICSTCVTQMLL